MGYRGTRKSNSPRRHKVHLRETRTHFILDHGIHIPKARTHARAEAQAYLDRWDSEGKQIEEQDDSDAIQEAERKMGADGTDDYFREMTTPERERDPRDYDDY